MVLRRIILFNNQELVEFVIISYIHLNISIMKFLCTVLYTFPMVLRRIILFNNQELVEFVIISYIHLNISIMKFLCTVLYTFPMVLRRIILFNNQELEFVIISYILMNTMFDSRVVPLGEIL